MIVRQSKRGEKIALLDGSEKELDHETLVIADHEKPLAIAGVMGGLDSSVTLLTKDILLESAYFSPSVIARQRQGYNLNSDSSYRFERGVDATIQREAIEYATTLILAIAGGEAGEVIQKENAAHLPKQPTITLKIEQIKQVLGISIPDDEVEGIFDSLHFKWQRDKNAWIIVPPSYRFDITLPEDVIEEIARVHGYDKIPVHHLKAELEVNKSAENAYDLHVLRQALSDQGYHEIISYSFVDKKLQSLLDPENKPVELQNPMTAEMEVMRTNLWPGLVSTLLYNKSRQQHRIRLFEVGTCFVGQGDTLSQKPKIAGLITGAAAREQWGIPSLPAYFSTRALSF